MKIETNTATERKTLIACLITLGYVWHRGREYDLAITPNEIERKYPFTIYPSLCIDSERSISGYYVRNIIKRDYIWPNDAKDIIRVCSPPDYTVDGIGEYVATVSKTGIKVGCQTITFDKFKELVKVVKDFQKAN
tara:strand:+ start:3648 stop:4052 length:405 start_codon:yes stop_codon:yes gene_type:complete